MNPEIIITILSAVGSLGIGGAAIGWWRDRKKLASAARIAKSTEPAQIGIVSVQELEAKLGLLNRVIAALETHNTRLEKDRDESFLREEQLSFKLRSVQARCDILESVIRRLCIDMGKNPDDYLPK